MDTSKCNEIEKRIGYVFKDKKHLETALTHKSYSNEKMLGKHENYERYEFLGDAILEHIVSDFLFNKYKEKSEGELTRLRASIVCEFTLSKIAREMEFGQNASFGKGELLTGGPNRDSILCDLFEAVLGAIYLDGGFKEAEKYVKKYLLKDIEHKQLFYDAKTKLQEYAQKHNSKPEYILVKEEGPEHDKKFFVEVSMDGKKLGSGEGHNKKTAEQLAAYNALNSLENDEMVR